MKKFSSFIKKYDFIIVLISGLTPLLWFQNNKVILGHDAGLPLLPIPHFLDRLFTWTDRFSFGVDQSISVAGFFIHGIEALVTYLGADLQTEQKITFIFWFLLPGVTMYIFTKSLERKLNIKYIAVPAAILYMFNDFTLQGWFIAERTKFSLYAALPLLILFLFDWVEGKRSTLLTSIYISILFFFLNGEASIPLFGGIIIAFLTFTFFYFYKNFNITRVKNYILLLLSTLIISVCLQAYWLFSYAYYVLHNFNKEVAQAGGAGGVLNWIAYISKDSSFINFFRLQGIPEWYENLSHPYASVILGNPLFITISFLFPILAFLPLVIIKDKKQRFYVLFFTFLCLLGMIFMAGSHPPFGYLYTFLIQTIPGFIAFRTPFYKFAPVLWFSYAILISISLYALTQKLNNNRQIYKIVIYILYILLIFIYSYPFFNGIFFDYIKNVRTMRIEVPQYVFDFGKWSNNSERDNTMLAIPETSSVFQVDTYTWGYWSLAPISTLLTNAPIISITAYNTKEQNEMLHVLYTQMQNNNPNWKKLARILGIDSFLLKKDFAWDLKDSPTINPKKYEAALHDPDLALIKSFGQWDVYAFKDKTEKKDIAISKKANVLIGKTNTLQFVSQLSDFSEKEPLIINETANLLPKEILPSINNYYIIPNCVNCDLQNAYGNYDVAANVLAPDSKLYFLHNLFDSNIKVQGTPLAITTTYLKKFIGDTLTLQGMMGKEKDNNALLAMLKIQNNDFNNFQSTLNDLIKNKSNSLEQSDLLKIKKAVKDQLDIMTTIENGVDKDIYQQTDANTSQIASTEKYLEGLSWETTTETDKRFFVTVPKEDNYTIKYISDIQEAQDNYSNFTIDGNSTNISQSVHLSAGDHKINVNVPIEYAYQHDQDVNLTTKNKDACFNIGTVKTDEDRIYRITFSYSTNSIKPLIYTRFNKLQPGFKEDNEFITVLNAHDEYLKEVPISTEGEDFTYAICLRQRRDNTDQQVTISNIRIRKVQTPAIVLSTNNPAGNTDIPVQYNKINQTKYEYLNPKIHTPYFLILNKSFNQNWVLNGNNAANLTVNGYANGWYISEDQKPKNTISYLVQNLLNTGFIVTGIGLLIIIIIIFIIKFRSRKYGKNA